MDIEKIDSSNMLNQIKSLPNQIKESIEIINEYKFKIKDFKNINSVLIVGMGGSAIGGDIVNSIISDCSQIPFQVIRDYNLPNWVNENTLVQIKRSVVETSLRYSGPRGSFDILLSSPKTQRR